MTNRFSPELLNNQIFQATDSYFNLMPPRKPDDLPASAAEIKDSGDYLLTFHAQGAQRIDILPWFGDPTPEGYAPWRDNWIHAEQVQPGVFQAVLPWDERKTGPRNIEIYVDGVYVIWPNLPIFWSGGHVYNYLEVPDPALDFSYIHNVPHGAVTHEYYFSKATNRYERCLIYTPPGYMNGQESYPVLYLQHGGTENETTWVSTGRVNFILDNLIAAGKCRPFLVVMNNGMIRYPENQGQDIMDTCFEDSLLGSCIPYIESHYRVIPDKWSRAIAGLSMGSMQTNDIGFRHPEVFGNMGSFTSTMYHPTFRTTYTRLWPEVMANPQKFMADYRVFFCSATPQEDHIPLFLEDARIMQEAGIEGAMPGYRRVLHDGRFIRWDSWRMGLAEFSTMLFREDPSKEGSL